MPHKEKQAHKGNGRRSASLGCSGRRAVTADDSLLTSAHWEIQRAVTQRAHARPYTRPTVGYLRPPHSVQSTAMKERTVRGYREVIKELSQAFFAMDS